MRIRKSIAGAAAAVMLCGGGVLVTAGGAAAATNNGGGGEGQCSSLLYSLSADQDTLHFWQLKRAQDAGHGVSTGLDDSEIDYYFSLIGQDIQALNDAGC